MSMCKKAGGNSRLRGASPRQGVLGKNVIRGAEAMIDDTRPSVSPSEAHRGLTNCRPIDCAQLAPGDAADGLEQSSRGRGRCNKMRSLDPTQAARAYR